MKQVPSVEAKYFNLAFNTSSSGNFTQLDNGTILAGIIQGTGNSQRVGRKIRVLGFVMRMAFTHAPGSYTVDLVRDKQCNGAAMANTEVYDDTFAGASVRALPNPLYEKRFQFIKRVESYNPSQAVQPTAGTNLSYNLISYSKKVNFTVEYDASTGAVTDLSSDNMAIWAAGTSTLTNVTGIIRVLYTDA